MNIVLDIKTLYIEHLTTNGVSRSSLKNYLSDLTHFSSWMFKWAKSHGLMPEELADILPLIEKRTGKTYKKYLVSSSPRITSNRRLSTLRHFSLFLFSEGLLHIDFMKHVKNLDSKAVNTESSFIGLVDDFEKHLINEKVSKNTLKNYLSDVRQFIAWLENHPDYPISN